MLGVVVERNQVQATAHLAAEMFEAWHQVMEVTLHAMLQDGVKREMKLAVIFEVIQDLLLKVRTASFIVISYPIPAPCTFGLASSLIMKICTQAL